MDEEQTQKPPSAEPTVPLIIGADGRPQPVEFEETPVLTPIVEEPKDGLTPEQANLPPQAQESPAPSLSELLPQGKPKRSPGGTIGSLVLFAVLFAIGVWLSLVVRPFFAGGFPLRLPAGQPQTTPVLSSTPEPAQPLKDAFANWKTYGVTNGATRQPIAGASFKLPASVAPPVCDAPSCASQGTDLPGGTRFTVAARGRGQLLADFRGGILTDISGQPFAMRQASISGMPATEYIATFSGRTAGGYTFMRMRGVMINATDTLTVEFNHFTPSSSPSADFAADDSLFERILQTVSFSPVVPPTELPASGSGGLNSEGAG